MYILWSSIVLITFCRVTVLSDSLPKDCHPLQVLLLKQHYTKEIYNKADDIANITQIFNEVDARVRQKYQELSVTVESAIQFAQQNNFNIYQCLNFQYLNTIPHQIQYQLTQFYNYANQAYSNVYVYIQRALVYLNPCANDEYPCVLVEACMKSVVNNFNEDWIESTVNELEMVGGEFLQTVLQRLENDIKYVVNTTNYCYWQTHPTTTTDATTTEKTTTETTEKPTTEKVTSKATEKTTTEEATTETTTGKTTTETTEKPTTEKATSKATEKTTTEEATTETTEKITTKATAKTTTEETSTRTTEKGITENTEATMTSY